MMIGLPFLKVIILMLEFTAIRIISNYLELCFYNKRKVILSKNGSFLVITVLSGLLLAYLLPYLGYVIDFNNILFNKAIILSIVLLGIVAFIRLYKYKHYNKVAKEYIKKEKVFINDGVMEDINFSTVKIDETKIDKNDLVSNIYEDKEGYEYLNSLFFLRHKNIMINSIKHIGIVIGIIFISIIVFIIFKPNVRPIVVKTFINSAPLMVFIMYTISTTERICKAMFYNCDKSLLRYSYYRNEKVILANFTSRLKKVMSINIIPAIELSLAFIIITICCGQPYSIIKVIPTCICIICLSGFFSIHHLFMYYVIQPYTAELTIKSPLFKTVNMVMYFLSYMCLRLKTSSYYFTIGVIITTIIYMIIALIVIYRVAPKTFKLK